MIGPDVGHLAVAAALTWVIGFERDLRRAPTEDRVFALIGTGTGLLGIIAAHGTPNVLVGAITGIGFIGGGLVFRQEVGRTQVITGVTTAAAIFAAAAIGAEAGEGRLLVASAATALTLLALEIRHAKVLSVLDGRRWADRFGDREPPPYQPQPAPPHQPQPATQARPQPEAQPQPRARPQPEAEPGPPPTRRD